MFIVIIMVMMMQEPALHDWKDISPDHDQPITLS